MIAVKEIKIGFVVHTVRHDYMHRGQRPRLMLQTREAGKYVEVQFNDNNSACSDIDNYQFVGKHYKGYWIVDGKATEIKITIKKTTSHEKI
jgi:hypothetical protein